MVPGTTPYRLGLDNPRRESHVLCRVARKYKQFNTNDHMWIGTLNSYGMLLICIIRYAQNECGAVKYSQKLAYQR